MAAGPGRLGGPGGSGRYHGHAGHRVTEAGPGRVLVLWCPDWPQASKDADARAFEQVVAVVEEFCPRVEVLRPGACAIGARGPARDFGGLLARAPEVLRAVD